MHTKLDRIIGADGNEVRLHGINWFGFNNGDTAPSGLWTGNPMASDFATVVARMRCLGFNAVRLPFSFKDFKKSGKDWTFDTGHVPTPHEIALTCGMVGDKAQEERATLPAPPKRTGTRCNDYLPAGTRQRFVWCAQFFAQNGFYVLIDNHAREDQTFLEDRAGWLKAYAALVADLCKDKATKARLMVDILNEPGEFEGRGVKWGGTSDTSLGKLYLNAMDAIDAVAQPLYFVEGTGQGAIGCNWGDGFCTDAKIIKDRSLGDPRSFFDALMTKRYKNRVVLSPHIYGPAVTGEANAPTSTGKALTARLTDSFGEKTRNGYQKEVYAVAIGEFGSRFSHPGDVACMHSLAQYCQNKGEGNDKRHHSILSWFYWCWNVNSGDTGGLVHDDWVTLDQTKLRFLRDLGL